jgi:hypothetical protein
MMNSFINYKTNSKKLQFGINKCKKMHVGKVCEDYKCQKVSVDSWVEVLAEDGDDSGNAVEDIFNGEVEMEESGAEKYLGDIISSPG